MEKTNDTRKLILVLTIITAFLFSCAEDKKVIIDEYVIGNNTFIVDAENEPNSKIEFIRKLENEINSSNLNQTLKIANEKTYGELIMRDLSKEAEEDSYIYKTFSVGDRIIFFDNYEASPITLLKSIECQGKDCDTIYYKSYHSEIYSLITPPKPVNEESVEMDSLQVEL